MKAINNARVRLGQYLPDAEAEALEEIAYWKYATAPKGPNDSKLENNHSLRGAPFDMLRTGFDFAALRSGQATRSGVKGFFAALRMTPLTVFSAKRRHTVPEKTFNSNHHRPGGRNAE